MSKRIHFPKIFFGWWTILSTGIVSLWGYGYRAYGVSALFKPISQELGFSRTATSVADSIGRFEGGFEAPLTGWITDKFGPKWIVFFGVFVISLSLILMNFVNSLWAFYVVFGIVLGTGVNIAFSIPIQTTISNWFVKKRGTALGVQYVFQGLSGVIVLPIIARLITVQGWRIACLFGGVVMAVVGLPLVWFFLKPHRPEYYGLLPDGASAETKAADTSQMIERGVRYAAEVHEVEFTLRQALKTPAFWLAVAANAANSLTGAVLSIHAIPFLTDRGIDPIKAASIMSIYIGASIPFRFVGGFFADRVRIYYLRFLIGGAYLLQAVGFAVFLLNQQNTVMIYVWFILYGIGYGANMSLFPAMRARYFGRKAYGSIQGSSVMFMSPISMLAPIYAGWVYDTTGSYIIAFTVATGLLVIAAAIIPFAWPPKPPAVVTDIRKIV